MQTFRFKNFRGIETKYDSTDQDRTALQRAEGVVPVPAGSLSNPPEWRLLWNSDVRACILAAIEDMDSEKTHLVYVQREEELYLVAWDKSDGRARGIFALQQTTLPSTVEWSADALAAGFTLEGSVEQADATVRDIFGDGNGVSVNAPDNSLFADKEPGVNWYGSWIDDRLFLGNGVDANLVWHNEQLRELGPSGAADGYDDSKVKIPPCMAFVLSDDRRICGAGNAAQPLRIWVAEPPTELFPFHEGIYSLERSFVDVTLIGAKRITALSHYQQMIVAHTDNGAAYYSSFERADTGYRARQRHSNVNSGAINQACVADIEHASFYFARDREVYHDHSVRAGSYEKSTNRDEEIATHRSSGDWNDGMADSVPADKAFSIYDRKNGRYWFWAPLSAGDMMGAYLYTQRNRSIMGPFRFPNLICGTTGRDKSTAGIQVAGVTEGGDFLVADLTDVGERRFPTLDAGSLGDEYKELTSDPEAEDHIPVVSVKLAGPVFGLKANGTDLILPSPWEDVQAGSVNEPDFWLENAMLSIVETGYQDFGRPTTLKDFETLQLTFAKHSRGYVGIFADSDGRRRQRWKGLIYPGENHRVRINLKGERLRIRLVIVSFNDAPATLRDLSVLYLPGVAR